MTRAALEHLLRAASAITNEREFVVIGSQAILGQLPTAPEALLVSIEADLYPRYAPENAELIDGAIIRTNPRARSRRHLGQRW